MVCIGPKLIVPTRVDGVRIPTALDADTYCNTGILRDRIAVHTNVLQGVGLAVRRGAPVGKNSCDAVHAICQRIKINGNITGVTDKDSSAPPDAGAIRVISIIRYGVIADCCGVAEFKENPADFI